MAGDTEILRSYPGINHKGLVACVEYAHKHLLD